MHNVAAQDSCILGIESDMSDSIEPAKKRNDVRKRPARAMTRAIDRVSEEFIEAFSQTGLDDGPEKPIQAEPVRQALLEREEREKREQTEPGAGAAQAPTFKGLGALLASAKKPTGNFARVFEPEAKPPDNIANQDATAAPAVNADGSVIKVRDTVGKKRGLYTSCMQRPDEAQLKAWAKMAEIEKAEAEKIKAAKEKVEQEKIEQQKAVAPASTETRSVLHKLASTSPVPSRQPIIVAPTASQAPPADAPAALAQTTAKQDKSATNFWQKLSDWFKGNIGNR